MRSVSVSLALTVLAVFALGSSGCVDERIVFRDRAPFNQPPDAATGFLGYFTASTKQTSCGNCHVGHQRDWRTSAHAGAYNSLVRSGSAQESCFGCHTVSERGNRVALAGQPAGWNVVKDSAYHDVQCESCHGPGFEHVQEPDRPGNVPLARMGLADTAASCGNCHSGSHHPFVEEWSKSAHSKVVTSPAGRPECASCHEGKAVLEAWGVQANYVERGSTTHQPMTCAVCHNPHGSGNTAQLRFAIDTPDPERNLCMKCHMRRTEPAGGSSYGLRPHAPQGAVLLGTAGYRPAGLTLDTTLFVSSHGPGGNPKLCAGCHVSRFTVRDPTTGNFQFQATGHVFRPIPCVDANGIPTADENCPYTETARSFQACVGCHRTAAIARSAFTSSRTLLKQLVDQVWTDLNGNGSIDAFPTDAGYLPRIKAARPGEFTPDATITAAEGAEFNARLVGEGLQTNTDNSKGVHNPFLARALISANIQELQQVYSSILPAASATVQEVVDETLRRATLPARSGARAGGSR